MARVAQRCRWISISDCAKEIHRPGGSQVSRFQRLYILGLGIGLFCAIVHSSPALSQNTPEWVATLKSVEGAVEARKATQTDWLPAKLNDTLTIGDSIRVLAYGRAAILLPDETVLRLDQNTSVTFTEPEDENRSWLELLKGAIHIISRDPRALKVITPFAGAGLEGTEFLIEVTQDETIVTVYEGEVSVSTDSGDVNVTPGQRVTARTGQQPLAQVVVRPQDAVQWTLYYAPILDYGVPSADEEEQAENPLYYTGRASARLAVGRVDEARADIAQALNIDPTNVDALALQSIIAVAQNDLDSAFALANRALALDADSAAAMIAFSYAQQAILDISGALLTMQSAVERHPSNGFGWARLSELWLAVGDLNKSLNAAQTAVSLNSSIARTQTVLGFAYLAQIEIPQAIDAFNKAIILDQAAPLPRLGLGLAMIRAGDLEAGRAEIEIAVVLDPGNALIRAYMGKAYYEEKRDDLAESQFDISKKLDPRDPTPWFYDAIRKRSINRPVEALNDLQKSIALNDNRAVYRSRLALDGDLATRGSSLAGIYDDLGFDQLAQVEASRSLSLDPSNHSAHRFLSDAYARLPRHEIARVSELLQSQLLQSENINPIRPSLSYVDLNPITRIGPAEMGVNEFYTLFERNRVRFTTSGAVGNQGTLGGDIVASGIRENLSFSAGASHIETDGFRDNNDQDNDIYNLFAQWAVSPKVNLQAEFRHRDTDQGDLEFNFDPDEFFPEDRRKIDEDVTRLGARFTPVPGSTVLFSGIYADRDEKLVFVDEFAGFVFTTEDKAEDTGHQVELQHILEAEQYNIITGIGALHSDVDFDTTFLVDGIIDGVSSSNFDQEHRNAYLYGDFLFPDNIRWTLGAGYVDFEQDEREVDEFEPKLGVEWDITDKVRLRGAFFKAIKRPLVVGQTIEPTEVAGFNQLYDDSNGSKSKRLGLGIDIILNKQLFTGFEVSRREIDFLFGPDFEDRQEDFFRAYLNWMINDRWAFTLDAAYEDYENNNPFEFNVDTPLELKTLTLPVSIKYFAPSGVFAQLQATYLYQDLERGEFAFSEDGEENVGLLDVAVGYRLPQRSGTVSLGVQNVLDKSFFYQDDSFRSADVTRTSGFIPERRTLLRVTFVF